MGLVQGQSHLAVIDQAFESKRRQTWPGMAYFAGTGPVAKTCRECVFWTSCGGEKGNFAKHGRHGGMIKPRSCSRYRELMQGDVGPSVPHNARACKYFSTNEAPPSIFER